ncbi:hypothetical protein GCM10010330_56540 [Streptomyces tendae]|uniref:hypothetical protein n=1 Tax=Streptomyces tendae TaxID=1932 RepID=UPI001678CDD0|nr:hypothetical protein [Streptomyces tendae]GHA95082.1 hypothetical protein GCM10010330_56540 [Streptomyces tendae]
MADGEREGSRDETPDGQDLPREEQSEPQPDAEFRMELVDSLPGGRAVMGVERKGEFMWLADRHHVSTQARDELLDQLGRIVREGWWVQNWPGAS